jgi:hypothetical protein
MAIPNTDYEGHGSGGLDASGNPYDAQAEGVQGPVVAAQGWYISMYYSTNRSIIDAYGLTEYDTLAWTNGQGGSEQTFCYGDWLPMYPIISNGFWLANTWPQPLPNGVQTNIFFSFTNIWSSNVTAIGPPPLLVEHCQIDQTTTFAVDQRRADCQIKLATGGKRASSKVNLWIISVTATAFYHPWITSLDGSEWAGGSNAPVPPQNISILGHTADVNNNVYLVLPDNTDIDITPVVNGQHTDYYTLNISPVEHIPLISANGIALDPVNVNSSAIFCVGQPITFALDVDFCYTNACVSFNLPSTFVNTNWQAIPSSSTNWWVNTSLTAFSTSYTPATTCWFTNGPGGTVSLQAYLTLPNGKVVSFTVIGQFMIVKPVITDFEPTPLEVSFQTNSGVSLGSSFGFRSYVLPPYNFSGIGTYAQLVQSSASYFVYIPILGSTPEGSSTQGGYWLDNNYPYGSDTPQLFSWSDNPTKYVGHADNPGLDPGMFAFCTSISITNQFKTYLQFQPAGGIPVTIGRVDWGWGCNATHSNGIWSWNCFSNQPTANWNDSTFPTWTNIFHNN